MAEGQCLWGKQPIKYCIDPSETLHKKTTCTVLTQSAHTCFRRKTGCSFKWLVACFLAGYNILNNLGSFYSMLARLFIYDFRDNNEQGPTWTGTSSQATFWKTNFLSFCEWKKPQMCFNEPDYVTVHSVMNIMTTNGAKMAQKNATLLFLSYYCLPLIGKGLLQAQNEKCCKLVKLLCKYFCYFILLNHG